MRRIFPILVVLMYLGFWGTIFFVAAHFIAKFW